MEHQAIWAVIGREFRRLARQRGRLLSTFARPLLWLVVVGSGFAAVMPEQSDLSYQQFLLPGIFGMVLLFSSMLSALGTVHDREFGAIRMLLVAPLRRSSVVLAKTVAATLIGAAQAILLLALVPVLGLPLTVRGMLMSAGGILLTAFALASLGMLVASRIRSLENFAVVMNFVLFPMFFLSGALYPASELPRFLQPWVLVNPLTYGVDLLKHAVLGPTRTALGGEYPVALSVTVLAFFSIVALAAATALFGREEHLSKILLSGAPKRRRAPVKS